MLRTAPFLGFLIFCEPHTREVMGSIPIGSTEIWECIDEMCSLFRCSFSLKNKEF